MTNEEKVIKAIEDKGYTITQYPCRANISIYIMDYKIFRGSVVKFEKKVAGGGIKQYTLFIADAKSSSYFHNGCSILGSDNGLPDILWFKEVNDRINLLKGFYI